jgi:folate-binding protein YgfZ
MEETAKAEPAPAMPDDYTAAHKSVAYAPLTEHALWRAGWLRLSGRDRLDLLHRLSTNDLKKLAAGEGQPTVLTSPTGRVMALVTVYADAEAAYVRLSPGQNEAIARYLLSMIFFQDEVEVADLTLQTAQFAVFGPRATDFLGRATNSSLGMMPPYGWQSATVFDTDFSVHRGGALEPWAWTVVTSLEQAGAVEGILSGGSPKLDSDTVELLRIEAGLPVWGRELRDQVTPLEAGLLPAINFNKGCYTGQEIIARQVNYDKVTRNLVGLVLPSDAPTELTGATVQGPGRGGFIGSAAFSPALDRPIALAIIPRDLNQPGAAVTVLNDGHEIPATVAALPFVNASGVNE